LHCFVSCPVCSVLFSVILYISWFTLSPLSLPFLLTALSSSSAHLTHFQLLSLLSLSLIPLLILSLLPSPPSLPISSPPIFFYSPSISPSLFSSLTPSSLLPSSSSLLSPSSSLERPPVMRLYRLPPPLSLYTSSSPACILQSVLYDTLTNDFKLTETIATLPPPVIEVTSSALLLLFSSLFSLLFCSLLFCFDNRSSTCHLMTHHTPFTAHTHAVHLLHLSFSHLSFTPPIHTHTRTAEDSLCRG
jgi:hypothetical protein